MPDNPATAADYSEWRDEKHLRICSRDEASITASFSIYAQFIATEKLRQDPYELSKLKRSSGTFTKKTAEKSEGMMQRAPNHNYNMNAPITVKGDNDQDVNITIKKPNEGAQALSLGQVPPQPSNFVKLENEADMLFRVTPLEEPESQLLFKGTSRAVHSELAPTTVEEWVASLSTSISPDKPLESIKLQDLELPSVSTNAPEDLVASLPKKRFGRNRKKPGSQDNDETVKSSSEPDQVLDTNTADPSIRPASTFSSSKALSPHSSPVSLPFDTHSSIPSTDNRTAPQDLLAGEQLAIDYPVITPVTVISSGETLTAASKESSWSGTYSLPPAWLRRKDTANAENGGFGLLVDAKVKPAKVKPPTSQPTTSYAAAVKRGTVTALKSKARQASSQVAPMPTPQPINHMIGRALHQNTGGIGAGIKQVATEVPSNSRTEPSRSSMTQTSNADTFW
ncbi:MAG: hypothetical protein L6R40_005979 [Gallowayella cf. fulva]|nr:MAG: hypothetical protein L6R40_005979 [Xanthomendoza cf. fulva]